MSPLFPRNAQCCSVCVTLARNSACRPSRLLQKPCRTQGSVFAVYDFLEKKKMDSLKELDKKVQMAGNSEKAESSNKISWEKKKEEEAAKRKLKNRLSKLESEINDLQQQLSSIEAKISNPSDYAAEINSGELYTQYNDIKNTIEEKEMEWLELQESD